MKQVAIMIFRPSDDLSWKALRLTLLSLRKASDCSITIFTNILTSKHRKAGQGIANICWNEMGSKIMKDRLMLFKVECLRNVVCNLSDDSQVICADADLYFRSNPFAAFTKSFDVGLTSRHYSYQYPINAGVVFIRVNELSRWFMRAAVDEIISSTWPPYIQWRQKFKRMGVDWYVDQDYYNVAYLNRNLMMQLIVDVGSKYNFCPHADGCLTEKGKTEMRNEYHNGNAVVLHLKSRLKELIDEGLFDE